MRVTGQQVAWEPVSGGIRGGRIGALTHLMMVLSALVKPSPTACEAPQLSLTGAMRSALPWAR